MLGGRTCSVLFYQTVTYTNDFEHGERKIKKKFLASLRLIPDFALQRRNTRDGSLGEQTWAGKMGLARVAHMAGERVVAAFVLTTYLTIAHAATSEQSEPFPAIIADKDLPVVTG